MPVPPDETFTSDDTWTKPSGAGTDWTHVVVTVIGGGGGGGAGGARTNNRAGGGGGGGSGGRDQFTIHHTDLAATVAVTVGVGGSGAPKRSVSGTGATGTSGGTTSFGSHGSATGGSGGTGGTAPASGAASGGSGGAAGTPNGAAGGAGGSGPTSGGGVAGSAGGAAAGGGGGGMTGTAPTEGNGGAGGASTDTGGGTSGAGGSGGGDPGDVGGNATQDDARGGGGGGASAGQVGTVGQDGGDGGVPGAGGGGGGAVRNSTATQSGGGGDGTDGQVLVHYEFEAPVSAVLNAPLGGLTATMVATPQTPVSAVLTGALGGLTATMVAGPQTAALPILLLNGNPTTGPDEWSVGGNDYLLVQDIASSSDDGAIVPFSLGSGTQTQSFPITNMPSNFQAMATLLWRIRYGSGVTNDQVSLQIRVVSRTSGAILAAANAGGTFQTVETWTTPFLFKNVGPTSFTYVNTGASKSAWDDAEIEFREIYNVNGPDDNGHVLVDAFEMSGTYILAPSSSNGEPQAGPIVIVT